MKSETKKAADETLELFEYMLQKVLPIIVQTENKPVRTAHRAALIASNLCVAASTPRLDDSTPVLLRTLLRSKPLSDLEKRLLTVVRETPGINRKGLFRTMGGHVRAARLTEALECLRARGFIVSKNDTQTGGRPAEQWFPQKR